MKRAKKRPLPSRMWPMGQNWVPMGYYKNRPQLMDNMRHGIGYLWSFRFVSGITVVKKIA